MDSGEISRDELMKEATDIMQKMKGMGGGPEGENNDFSDILKNLTKGMGGGMGNGMGDGKMNDIFKHLAKSMATGATPNPNDIFKNLAKSMENKSKETNKTDLKKKSENKSNTNFILEKSDPTKNNYVFKLPGEELQNRSDAPITVLPAFTDEELIAEFEKDKVVKTPHNPKKKQNKKKKGK